MSLSLFRWLGLSLLLYAFTWDAHAWSWQSATGVKAAQVCNGYGDGDAYCTTANVINWGNTGGTACFQVFVGPPEDPEQVGPLYVGAQEWADTITGVGGGSGQVMYGLVTAITEGETCSQGDFGPITREWAISYECGTVGVRAGSAAECEGAASCDTNRVAKLEVNISSPNPPSSEYTEVCFGSCRYDIVDASIFVDRGVDPPVYFMGGEWISNGATCGENAPVMDAGQVQDPAESGGAAGGSEEGPAAAQVGDAIDSQKDGLEGAPLALPGAGRWLWSFTNWLPAGSCAANMTWNTPNLSWLNGKSLSLNFCAESAPWVQPFKDLMAWLLAISTAFGIWLITFRGR